MNLSTFLNTIGYEQTCMDIENYEVDSPGRIGHGQYLSGHGQKLIFYLQ